MKPPITGMQNFCPYSPVKLIELDEKKKKRKKILDLETSNHLGMKRFVHARAYQGAHHTFLPHHRQPPAIDIIRPREKVHSYYSLPSLVHPVSLSDSSHASRNFELLSPKMSEIVHPTIKGSYCSLAFYFPPLHFAVRFFLLPTPALAIDCRSATLLHRFPAHRRNHFANSVLFRWLVSRNLGYVAR